VAGAVVQQDSWFIRLFGGFELRGPEGIVEVTPGVQRLLAFVALQGGSVPRTRAANELWPAVPAAQAAASLRSTVWRARRLGPLLRPGVTTLRLGPDVEVDTDRLDAARQGVDGVDGLHDLSSWAGTFHLELLPDWPDEWVTLERERLRHVELQVLDDQVAALASRGRVTDALDTALRAIRLEPLRESSHQALIRIFLESGNRSAALSHYQAFVSLLRSELGLPPDPRTTALVQSLLSTRTPTTRPWRTGPGARDKRPGRPPRGR
jgi:DNA-binding SARP family transcriptional activator